MNEELLESLGIRSVDDADRVRTFLRGLASADKILFGVKNKFEKEIENLLLRPNNKFKQGEEKEIKCEKYREYTGILTNWRMQLKAVRADLVKAFKEREGVDLEQVAFPAGAATTDIIRSQAGSYDPERRLELPQFLANIAAVMDADFGSRENSCLLRDPLKINGKLPFDLPQPEASVRELTDAILDQSQSNVPQR